MLPEERYDEYIYAAIDLLGQNPDVDPQALASQLAQVYVTTFGADAIQIDFEEWDDDEMTERAMQASDDNVEDIIDIVDGALAILRQGTTTLEHVNNDFDKFMGRILQEEKRNGPAAIVTDSPQRLRAARHQERPMGRTRIGLAR